MSRVVELTSRGFTRTFDAAFIHARYDIDESGCWNWTGAKGVHGRGVFNHQYAYRISYTVFVGDIPAGFGVNHHCDNPACVNPDHLYAGTQQQNMADMWSRQRGTSPRLAGADHPRALPSELVDQIRNGYAAGGTTIKQLAATHGISYTTAKKWINGHSRGLTPVRRANRRAS